MRAQGAMMTKARRSMLMMPAAGVNLTLLCAVLARYGCVVATQSCKHEPWDGALTCWEQLMLPSRARALADAENNNAWPCAMK
jgi:hypothetical protein